VAREGGSDGGAAASEVGRKPCVWLLARQRRKHLKEVINCYFQESSKRRTGN